ADEPSFRAARQPVPATTVRLLPSGDTYLLHWGCDRDLIVPDPARRAEAWTTRVWPGIVLVGGEVAGTWRRAEHQVSVRSFETLDAAARRAIEAEAERLPLPGLRRSVTVRWAS
ncbi:MAG TPA: crosslink repair DNA glycosylase YcaQ family protein, partial [Candidatus Limnocylindrales bacterium]